MNAIKDETAACALYVHIPWCVKKCPYCDFNSHTLRESIPEQAYVDALLLDLQQELQVRTYNPLKSIFIGGGTPSLFSAEAVARLLEGISGRLPLSPDCEITLEANPGTIEAGRFVAFRSAGVNRLSIGIQSFDDEMLTRIGRIHDGRQSRLAVEQALTAGFDSFNLDLMYGLPGQTAAQAVEDTDTAIRFGPTHISHYQLTIEPNTLFYRQPPALPRDEHIWNAAMRCQQRLHAAGYQRYEISAYARPGHECRHNRNYWRFGDYLGIGAGAHGKTRASDRELPVRSLKHRHPRAYLDAAVSGSFDLSRAPVAPGSLPLEFMMNALRLTQGFELSLFPRTTGLALEAIRPQLETARRRGFIVLERNFLRPTALGARFLNDLLLEFAAPTSKASASRTTVRRSPPYESASRGLT